MLVARDGRSSHQYVRRAVGREAPPRQCAYSIVISAFCVAIVSRQHDNESQPSVSGR